MPSRMSVSTPYPDPFMIFPVAQPAISPTMMIHNRYMSASQQLAAFPPEWNSNTVAEGTLIQIMCQFACRATRHRSVLKLLALMFARKIRLEYEENGNRI